ncbi:hypothetical protein MKW98_008277 [Papaver atlanticum]|uniref:FBD domain-containing protein n=1 Tax=Papaver atlanticum TaxID=357466 RepID=A0AAD4XBY4_9MAGN|nr:hypothetical protein MKW98_008277 [Papaver atlanticum]
MYKGTIQSQSQSPELSHCLHFLGKNWSHGFSFLVGIIHPEVISPPLDWVPGTELQRLFSSCPPMEMVVIQDCDVQMSDQRNIVIDSHSLQFCSAIDSLTCTTKISAPNVKEFICTGFMTGDFSLENFSSLVGAHLNMRLRGEGADETAKTYSELLAEENEVFAKRMMKYLGAVHNVHHLTLSSGFLEVLLQAPSTLYRQPPQLCNLETLKLEMRFTRGSLRSIAYLLKISPVITSLILTSKESNLADVGDDWESGLSLTCMFSHLKFVEIREVEGCDNELKFLTFLLKNSMVLEKLSLFFRYTSDSLDRGRYVRRFKRNLKLLPTASSSIQMHFF